MKPLFTVFVLAVLLAPAAFGQEYPVDRGSWLVGGSASLVSQEVLQGGVPGEETERATLVTLRPSAQYFVIPGLAVGADLTLAYSAQDDFSTTTLGAGPSLGYYVGGPDRRAVPFVATRLSVQRSSVRVDTDLPFGFDLDRTQTRLVFDVSGGGLVMLARNVGVTGELFYSVTDNDLDDDDRPATDAFGLRFGIAAFVF